MDTLEILKIIWPLVIIQVAFQIYALVDLWSVKKGKTKNLTNIWWTIIIVVGELLGPTVYFIFGRSEE